MTSRAPCFSQQTAVLATMHRKEQVIAPVLQAALNLQVRVLEGFDSDAFGTFTRDVARSGSQLDAARAKVQRALDLTAESLGLASEGSFGPHPAMSWLPCDREIVLLCDRANGWEIVGEALSLETNYRQQPITSVEEAWRFAQEIGFPEHGLVVMPTAHHNPKQAIYKGLVEPEQLIAAVTQTLAHHGTAWLETDMRALYNPTRMKVIEQATQDLAEKVLRTCPQCNWPGFSVCQEIPGLPCELCGLPTLLTQSWRYGCQRCGYTTTLPFPHGQTYADPGQCEYCNP